MYTLILLIIISIGIGIYHYIKPYNDIIDTFLLTALCSLGLFLISCFTVCPIVYYFGDTKVTAIRYNPVKLENRDGYLAIDNKLSPVCIIAIGDVDFAVKIDELKAANIESDYVEIQRIEPKSKWFILNIFGQYSSSRIVYYYKPKEQKIETETETL